MSNDLESKLEDSANQYHFKDSLKDGSYTLINPVKHFLVGYLPQDIKKWIYKNYNRNEIKQAENVNLYASPLVEGLVVGFISHYINPEFPEWNNILLGVFTAELSVISNLFRRGGSYNKNVAFGHPLTTIPYNLIKSVYINLSDDYKKNKQKRFKKMIKSHQQEKTQGTLSLPPPNEEGRLSINDKEGAVSFPNFNDDNYDVSPF